MTPEEIKELAFDWSVDYKPWEEDLPPNEYARYGYEQGYKRALEDQMRINGLRILASQLERTVGEAQAKIHNSIQYVEGTLAEGNVLSEWGLEKLNGMLKEAQEELKRLY